MEMHNYSNNTMSELFGHLASFTRRCIFRVLSVGPIPGHLSFIMDGNRRFAMKRGEEEGAGHKAGFTALMAMLKYCYELGVKYVSVYAFSIDNFNRRPDEVRILMDLMLEKTEGLLKEESLVHRYGVRVCFIGNLRLLRESNRIAAEKVMKATVKNTNYVLLICVAYTSTNEITNSVLESCLDKWNEVEFVETDKVSNGVVKEVKSHEKICNGTKYSYAESGKGEAEELQPVKARPAYNGVTNIDEEISGHCHTVDSGVCGKKCNECRPLRETRTGNGGIRDEEGESTQSHCIIHQVEIEKNMYMAVAPDPDVIIRTSGENRLSNYLLWQSSNCELYAPNALWPEIGLRHLVWAVLNFQSNYSYLEKKKKQK